MNKDPPKIAQFTAIKGRKIPNAPYKAGANFSTIISTNWTIEAITAINIIKLKKSKFNSAYLGPTHESAPSFNKYLSIKKFT